MIAANKSLSTSHLPGSALSIISFILVITLEFGSICMGEEEGGSESHRDLPGVRQFMGEVRI